MVVLAIVGLPQKSHLIADTLMVSVANRVDTLSHTVNRLFYHVRNSPQMASFGLYWLLILPWTRKTNIVRLITKYIIFNYK